MEQFWREVKAQALLASEQEPSLASFYYSHILNHASFDSSLSFTLAECLGNKIVPASLIRDVILQAMRADESIATQARADLEAVYDRDAACDSYLIPLLYFKGFQALQSYRVAHHLWQHNRQALAQYFQSLVSEQFHVDIHPAAKIGCGIMLDHATGIVIGETAEIGNDVSMLHSVTLGGSGCGTGKRHPTIHSGVLIATGAKILGPVVVGESAKIAAGSVVTTDVEPLTTVAGVPAKVVNSAIKKPPALDMQQEIGPS